MPDDNLEFRLVPATIGGQPVNSIRMCPLAVKFYSPKLMEGLPITDIRIVAIVVGIAIVFGLEHWLDASWYIFVPFGVIGYLITRYIGWAVTERRNLNRQKEEWLTRAKRGADHQNSN